MSAIGNTLILLLITVITAPIWIPLMIYVLIEHKWNSVFNEEEEADVD